MLTSTSRRATLGALGVIAFGTATSVAGPSAPLGEQVMFAAYRMDFD